MDYIQRVLNSTKLDEDMSYFKSILELVKTLIEFGFSNEINTFKNMVYFIKKLIATVLRANR